MRLNPQLDRGQDRAVNPRATDLARSVAVSLTNGLVELFPTDETKRRYLSDQRSRFRLFPEVKLRIKKPQYREQNQGADSR